LTPAMRCHAVNTTRPIM